MTNQQQGPPEGHPGPPPGGYPTTTPGGYGYPPGGFAGTPLLPAVAPSGQPLASFSDRLLARLIDSVIVAAANLVLVLPGFLAIFFIVFSSTDVAPDGSSIDSDPFVIVLAIFGVAVGITLVSLVLSYVYEVEMMFRRGQTIGKRAINIRVAPIDGTASLTRAAAGKRFLCFNVGGAIIPFFRLIDGLWQLWDQPYRQCLHDKFATTVVVKIPDGGAMEPKGSGSA